VYALISYVHLCILTMAPLSMNPFLPSAFFNFGANRELFFRFFLRSDEVPIVLVQSLRVSMMNNKQRITEK
jgi:hypothetical protein